MAEDHNALQDRARSLPEPFGFVPVIGIAKDGVSSPSTTATPTVHPRDIDPHVRANLDGG